jgi:hypothetical protein
MLCQSLCRFLKLHGEDDSATITKGKFRFEKKAEFLFIIINIATAAHQKFLNMFK